MQVAYVSGPYRGKHWWDRLLNIWRARQASIELWKQDYAVICPHMNTAWFDNHGCDWLKGDLEFIKRLNPETDFLYMLKRWRKSPGAIAEWLVAKELGIKIVYEGGEPCANTSTSTRKTTVKQKNSRESVKSAGM